MSGDDNNNNPPTTIDDEGKEMIFGRKTVFLWVCMCVRVHIIYICWWRSMAFRPHSSSSSQPLASQSKAGQRSLSQRINSRFTPAKFVCRKIYRGVNARKDEILWIKYIIFSPESSCFYVPFGDIRFYILFYFFSSFCVPARGNDLQRKDGKKEAKKGFVFHILYGKKKRRKIKRFMDFVTHIRKYYFIQIKRIVWKKTLSKLFQICMVRTHALHTNKKFDFIYKFRMHEECKKFIGNVALK